MFKKTSIFIIVTAILISAGYSHASGFRTFELSARAATLGGAFVARVDDASAIYYNPAGIAFLDGIRLKLNVLYNDLTTTANYEGAISKIESFSNQIWGSYFFSWQLSEKISLGIGGFVPYAMDTNWPRHWRGITLNDNSRLRTFYIRPQVAFKVFDKLSIGAGLDFVLSEVSWDHNIIFQSDAFGSSVEADILSKFKVSGNGLGFAVGILYTVNDKLKVGSKYQHKVDIDLKGDNFYRIPYWWELEAPIDLSSDDLMALESLMRYLYKYQKVTSVITMPAELALGFMYSLTNKLTLQLDLQWTGWSKIKTWEFISESKDENLGPEFVEHYWDSYGKSPSYSKQSVDFSWKDTVSFKLGAEFYLNDFFAFRAGYTNQQSYLYGDVLSPILLDLNRNTVSFGIGYEGPMFDIFDVDQITGEFSFDAFFQYVFPESRTSSLFGLPVSYEGDHWTTGIGVGFNF